jgi:hypothetical protein
MKATKSKMTVYLDRRSLEEPSPEELQEQEQKQAVENVMGILNGLLTYTVILPLLFMVSFNVSLTKMFNFANIGYVESLGVVIVARVLRGKK